MNDFEKKQKILSKYRKSNWFTRLFKFPIYIYTLKKLPNYKLKVKNLEK